MKLFCILSLILLFMFPVAVFSQSDNSISENLNTHIAPAEAPNSVSATMQLVGSDQDDFIVETPDPKGNGAATGLSVMAVPANNNCSSAIGLVVGAPCISGTTKESNIQTGEAFDCQGTPNQSVWYKFLATSANMFVEVERTASSGCYLSSAVYSGGCLPANSTSLSCEDASYGPNLNIHNLTNLNPGSTYLIQVAYKKGSVCGSTSNTNSGANFCIRVGNSVICNTCGNSCGSVCMFASAPSVTQVTGGCTEYKLASRLNTGETRKQCYTFTAVAASFALQMIINSTGCAGGNVTTFNWELYGPSCGTPLQSGNLSNLNATGLSIGVTYTLCYEWTAACQHNSVWPYIIATSPLPISLLYFEGKQKEHSVELEWITASEKNNNYFSVQRSSNGTDFTEIGKIPGAGTSNNTKKYNFTDTHPQSGINYYRLVQYDYDNTTSTSKTVAIRFDSEVQFQLLSNPVEESIQISAISEDEMYLTLEIISGQGQVIQTIDKNIRNGKQTLVIPASSFSKGTYFLKVSYTNGTKWMRFVKM